MAKPFCPRLSEASDLLPLLRGHLINAANRCPLPAGMTLELLPIVDDGIFGYELSPDRGANTYLMFGRDEEGHPALRTTSFGNDAAGALRLVAMDGRTLSRTPHERPGAAHQRTVRYADWSAAADAAFAELLTLFPERPRRPIAIREHAHR